MRTSSFACLVLVISTFGAACGQSAPGGQGIGFSVPPAASRASAPQGPQRLQIGRVYLPRDRAGAYVEIINASEQTLELKEGDLLHLQSHAARIALPVQGAWQPGESRRLEGDELQALSLHAQAGELMLLGQGSVLEAYGTWGAHPTDWPTGYGALASRLGVQTPAAYPLPLHLREDVAIDVAQSAIGAPSCQPAQGERAHEAVACEASEQTQTPRVLVHVDADGETIHLGLNESDPDATLDVFGMRLCNDRICQTLMREEPLRHPRSSHSPQAMRFTLGNQSAPFGTRAQTLRVTNEEVIHLLAPGDSPGSDSRSLANSAATTSDS